MLYFLLTRAKKQKRHVLNCEHSAVVWDTAAEAHNAVHNVRFVKCVTAAWLICSTCFKIQVCYAEFIPKCSFFYSHLKNQHVITKA